jgi:DNA-binding MarR family transcriptional regulator
VSGLSARRLVLRADDKDDGRGVKLRLFSTGRRLYEGLIAAAAERNDAFLGCLSAKEQACLEGALDKLAEEARRFIQSEDAR